jgi:pectin methylesterase-like acyl-CoA thioesterase
MVGGRMKRLLSIGIIILFIGMSLSSSTGFDLEKKSIPLDGKTLYVGGSGPGNYTKIQDAIDNASDGDTVFVYSGKYEERDIIVNKSISLIGENKETTIVDGNQKRDIYNCCFFIFSN